MALNNTDLYGSFQHLYTDELPAFIDSLKSIENLPASMRESIATLEQNIEQNKKLIEPLVSGGISDMLGSVGAVAGTGGIAGGILGKIAKKQAIRKFSGKKLVAIQDNATHFNDTIARMKRLIGGTQDSKPDYEHLTEQEKRELLVLAEEMKTLSEELTEQLAA